MRAIRPARQNRPVRPAIARESGVAMMDRTHREMEHVLAQMMLLATLIGKAGQESAASALAKRICHFFNGPARHHHEAEETEVFPGLLSKGDAELRDHVRRLQQDHMWLEEDWLELEPHLQAVASGYESEHEEFLRAGLPEFVALCQEHMALEESLVHPGARAGLVAPNSDARG